MQGQVLGRDAGPEATLAADAQLLGLLLAKRLRGQDVLAFRGADAECHGAEATIGAGMTVAADHGKPGRTMPSSGPITWTMP